MIRTLCLIAALICPISAAAEAPTAAPVADGFAEAEPQLHGMLRAMGVYDILAMMTDENLQGGVALEASLFPGQGGAEWLADLQEIHATQRLVQVFEDSFPVQGIRQDQIAEISAFLDTGIGRDIVQRELRARALLMDPNGLEDSEDALMRAMDADDPVLDLLLEFIDGHDLIERNVSSGLNAQFATARGLIDGGAFGDAMTQDQMLANVWEQQGPIRQAVTQWLFSFYFTAFSDIDPDHLRQYIDMSQTEAGRAVQNAIFIAFDNLMVTVGYDVGQRAAPYLGRNDL